MAIANLVGAVMTMAVMIVLRMYESNALILDRSLLSSHSVAPSDDTSSGDRKRTYSDADLEPDEKTATRARIASEDPSEWDHALDVLRSCPPFDLSSLDIHQKEDPDALPEAHRPLQPLSPFRGVRGFPGLYGSARLNWSMKDFFGEVRDSEQLVRRFRSMYYGPIVKRGKPVKVRGVLLFSNER